MGNLHRFSRSYLAIVGVAGASFVIFLYLREQSFKARADDCQRTVASLRNELKEEERKRTDLSKRIDQLFQSAPIRLPPRSVFPRSAETPDGAELPQIPPEIVWLPDDYEISPDRTRVYTGKPISLQLHDVPLSEAIVAITVLADINVVVTKDVVGTVDLNIQDIRWDKALQQLLDNNELDSVAEWGIVRVSTKKRLDEERAVFKDMLTQAKKTEADALPGSIP